MAAEIKRNWEPHPKQRDVLHTTERFRICPAGRRSGKTEVAANLLAEAAMANENHLYWWVAPTYEDANELGYDRILSILPRIAIKRKSRASPRHIELWNGTRIGFRSADRPDSLVGRGLHGLVIDEAGIVENYVWEQMLRPALSDHLGWLVAIGTPRGRNWFYNWYKRGLDTENADVSSWTWTGYDNPYVADSEIEAARDTLPVRVFEQEYLAKFLDDGGAVFGNVAERNLEAYTDAVHLETDWGAMLNSSAFRGPYTIGVDMARTRNFFVTTVLDADGKLAAFDRRHQQSWARMKGVVDRHVQYYRPNVARIDATRDNKIVQDIEQSGTTVDPVRFTPATKRELVDSLAARLETKDILIHPMFETPLVDELEAYEFSVTDAGTITYSAPAGMNDDCVDSLALAARKGTAKVAGTWGKTNKDWKHS